MYEGGVKDDSKSRNGFIREVDLVYVSHKPILCRVGLYRVLPSRIIITVIGAGPVINDTWRIQHNAVARYVVKDVERPMLTLWPDCYTEERR